MCGITGIIGGDSREFIVPMTEALRHRGPDGFGYHRDHNAALGHTRLSIIDIDGGQQPIQNSNGTLTLVCNGEIYNSPELRKRFVSAGYQFRTKTDVEVILPLYEKYGTACVNYLRGMFAFAIWDVSKQSLMLARDHMGQKPLHYAHHAGQLLFASEPKALLASGVLPQELDLEAMWHYMSLRYIPDDRSLFAPIKKLEAGHVLTYTNETNEIKKECYWSPVFEPKYKASEEELTDQLDELMRDTVDKHLLSDVPVGAFLSGGIDSGTVSAMMATLNPDLRVPSFTIGVKDASFDESGYARSVAKKFGMDGHFQVVDANLIDMAPRMIRAMDEPADPFGAGVFMVSELARKNVKVVLTGDGGDENYAGYDRYSGQRLVDYYCLLPAWLRKSVIARITNMVPESFAYKSFAQKAAWMNDMADYSRGDRYARSLSFLRFTDEHKKSLWTGEAMSHLESVDSKEKVLRYFEADTVNDLIDKMLYTDMKTRLPDHLLAISDRMSMAHSLETRPVLVDKNFVEFSARVPCKYKLKGTQLKYLLRRVAERYLPKELIYRQKQGFSFPIGRWLRKDLRDFTHNLFAESRFVDAGIFNREHIDKIFSEHVEGKADHNYRLWMLINFELWYRMYFENASIEDIAELTTRLRHKKAT
jgi:asparagine synthase (glutamine-hydrolysing)